MAEVSFGEWLKRQRKASGLTQEQLAGQIGCAAITLRKIEAEERRPSEQIVNRLAHIFKIPPNEQTNFLRFSRGDWQAFVSTVAEYAPWRELTTIQSSSLPIQITSFIGREKEQGQVNNLLNKYRLVTLTGSGGVGKTRLALKIGGQVLGDYAHGVWLVELDSLSDPALLLQTVTRVFGIATQSDISLTEILISFLRVKTTLLILDNCEHLLDACAHLTDILLKNCPNLKILATSREQLGLTGEAIFRVPSLGLPHGEQALEKFQEFESARLFAERAKLVQRDFSLTVENIAFVSQICYSLDGIPLALELAAAKVGSFSPKEIADQIALSFNLLTDGSRTDSPRQQTIRTSINWSWGLLTEVEQAFMRQLSVFAGGWTLESALAVCKSDVLSLTNSLVKKSLIVAEQETGNGTRYHFHEVIRHYAREKLAEAGEEEKIRNRHLEYFRELAKQAKPYFHNAKQLMWLDCLETELANIRAALFWASNGGSISAGLDLVGDLSFFWFYRADVKQIRVYVENLLGMSSSSKDSRVHAKGFLVAGYLAYFAGDLAMARERLATGEVLWQKLGESGKTGLAETRDMLIDVDFYFDHNLNLARRRYEDNLALCKEVGDSWLIAQAIYQIAWITEQAGDLIAAQRGYITSLALFRDQGDEIRACGILNANLGQLTFKLGDFIKARQLLEEGLNIARQTKHQLFLDIPLHLLGVLAAQKGDFPRAKALYTECIKFEQENGETRQIARCLIGFASIAMAKNFVKQAAQLLGAAETQIEASGTWWENDVDQGERERLAKLLPTLLDDGTFAALFAEGRAMRVDEAVKFAIDEIRL